MESHSKIIQQNDPGVEDPIDDELSWSGYDYFRTPSPSEIDRILFGDSQEDSLPTTAAAVVSQHDTHPIVQTGTASTQPIVGDLRCHEARCGCNKHFESKTRLERHLALVRSDFKCEEPDCPSAKDGNNPRFGTESDLRRHGKDVHGPNQHFCPWDNCKKKIEGFPRATNLKSHISSMHDGKRPHEDDNPPKARPTKKLKTAKGKERAGDIPQRDAALAYAAPAGYAGPSAPPPPPPISLDGTVDPRHGVFNVDAAPIAPMVIPPLATASGPSTPSMGGASSSRNPPSDALVPNAEEEHDQRVVLYQDELRRMEDEDRKDIFELQTTYENMERTRAQVQERQRFRSSLERLIRRSLNRRIAHLRSERRSRE